MRTFTRIIAYMLAGALAFWTPDILLQSRRGADIATGDILLLTLLLPWALFSVYRVLLSIRGGLAQGPSIALYMLLGVWTLGSTAMMVGASFTDGLPQASDALDLDLLAGFLPSYTYSLSTFDGSFYALLLSTGLMILLHLKYERGSWLIPTAIFRGPKKL